MIKKHTAQSLGKYLGDKIGISSISTPKIQELSGRLSTIDIEQNHIVIRLHNNISWLHRFDSSDAPNVIIRPILKTYERLIEPMEFEGKTILPVFYIFGICKEKWRLKKDRIEGEDSSVFTIWPNFNVNEYLGWGIQDYCDHIEKLIQLGFGAIPDSESPTGYVDLFGYVCEVEK